MHHKFRVHVDPAKAGLGLSAPRLRDAVIHALRAEGLEIVLWQSVALSAQTVFQKRDPLGGFPRAQQGGTDLADELRPRALPPYARAARRLARPLLAIVPAHRPG